MLIVLVIVLGAILVGAGLYFYGPEEIRDAQVGPSASVASAQIPFQVIAEGESAAEVRERKNYAVYSEEDLEELWRMAYGDTSTLPRVDFTQNYVIAVFAGEKASGGHDIEVADIEDTESKRKVSIALTRPGAGCMTTQALTRPFQIVVVPASDLELAREEAEIEVACQ